MTETETMIVTIYRLPDDRLLPVMTGSAEFSTFYMIVSEDDHPDLSAYDGEILKTAARFKLAVFDNEQGLLLMGRRSRLLELSKEYVLGDRFIGIWEWE